MLNQTFMRPYQRLLDHQITSRLKTFSPEQLGLVRALVTDMRNYAVDNANCDVFASVDDFREQVRQNRENALLIWPHIQRMVGNKFLETASKIFMRTAASRDLVISGIWSQLSPGTPFVQKAASDWQHKHNELLRINDYEKIPKGLN